MALSAITVEKKANETQTECMHASAKGWVLSTVDECQMTSTRPYLRKKAVLIMYKVFLKFPDALRPAFPRLKEKLEDPDPGLWFLQALLLLCVSVVHYIRILYLYFTPGEVQSIVMSMYVCLFVCLSVCSHDSKTAQPNFTSFLCMLPVAMAWSFSGSTVIHYVFPVLRVMLFSYHGAIGQNQAQCYV